MNEFATWLFLGLVLPQFGAHQEALKVERYRRMDASHAVDVNDIEFMKFAESGELGKAMIVAITRDQKVMAVVVAAEKNHEVIEGMVLNDARCSKSSIGKYYCQLGDPSGGVNVDVCAQFAILYSDTVASSRAHAAKLCSGPVARGGLDRSDADARASVDRRQHSPGDEWVRNNWTVIAAGAAAGIGLILGALGFLRIRRPSKAREGHGSEDRRG